MLARSLLRSASRRAFRPAIITLPIQQRATFKSASKHNDPEVPVVHYENGRRMEESLHVPAGPSGPVAGNGEDVQAVASPFRNSVMEHITPTLAKFTLMNKVAIVTG